MNDPQSSSQAPRTVNADRGFVGIITALILVSPIAALAAGVGAFFGMSVGVAAWGQESLAGGAAVGAGVGVLLVSAWAVVFVGRVRASKEEWQIHAEKLAAYFQDMKSRGVESHGGDPTFRMLWMLGLKVPPPLFLGTLGNFLHPVGILGAIILTADAINWWQRPNYPMWIMWVAVSIFLLPLIGVGVYNVKATRSMALKL